MELSAGCYRLQRRGAQDQLRRIREDFLEEMAMLNPQGPLGCRCGEVEKNIGTKNTKVISGWCDTERLCGEGQDLI